MFNLTEFIKVVFRYYGNLSFAKADLSILWIYLLKNPFRISRDFLAQKGEADIYQYGETPLTTIDLISRECGISADDHVFELGCGRGRTCFWLNSFKGCKVTGIDFVPFFIEQARKVSQKSKIKDVNFILENYLKADLTQATCLYLYGSNMGDPEIEELCAKLEQLPVGTKVITTSFALEDYAPGTAYQTMKCFPAAYAWGEADVYFQIKVK